MGISERGVASPIDFLCKILVSCYGIPLINKTGNR